MRFIVLGGYGAMGRITVRDLFETSQESEVIIVGRDQHKAQQYAASFRNHRVQGRAVDVNNQRALVRLLDTGAVVINALPYALNLKVMRAAFVAHAHYIDLGGLYAVTKQQLKLHHQFKKHNLLAVLGCGSTPGVTNVMIAYAAEFFDRMYDVHIRFGGHDWTRHKQLFVVPYNPYTLFDEFTKDPIIFQNGTITSVQPMSGTDTYPFPNPVGKMTCFYTRHSELATIPQHYQRKGLKNCSFRVCFPDTFVYAVQLFIDLGFASSKNIQVDGVSVKPIDITSHLMAQYALPRGVTINDMEQVLVDITGRKNGKKKKCTVYCTSHSIPRWHASAGAVDTGVPPSIVAQMIVNGCIKERGVLPPEQCVPPKMFFKELAQRGMRIHLRWN